MRILLIGAARQARLCHEILTSQGHEVPYAYDRTMDLEPKFPCRISTNEQDIPVFASECDAFLVCIGAEHGLRRAGYSKMLLDLGLAPASAVHPTTFIPHTVKVGVGLQAMPRATVNNFAEIGDWCILNTGCVVDHECKIGNGVHIMPGATVAGDVTIGHYSTIGTNATVLPSLTLGSGCFVGAGAVVLHDVPDDYVMVGNPARLLRRRIAAE